MAQARPQQAAQRPAAPARPTQRPAPARQAPAQVEEESNGGSGYPATMPMSVTGSIPTTATGDRKAFAGRSGTVSYDFGSTLDEAVEKFGEAVVFGVFLDQAVIRLQAMIRRKLESEKAPTQKELDDAAANWKMTVGGRERKSAAEKVNDLLGKMSPEARAELLKSLKAGK